jgi:hypothetical protein
MDEDVVLLNSYKNNIIIKEGRELVKDSGTFNLK